MKRTALVSLFFVLIGSNVFAAKTTTEETALRELTSQFAAAWNKHDAKALTATFGENATVINPMGRRANGRDAIQTLFNDEHTTFMKDTQATMTVETFRFPRPDVAFLDTAMEITGMKTPDGKDLPLQRMHVTALAAKQGKRWLWLEARAWAFMTPPAEVATKN
jgi:uncharacterized protein (TIGR02246 family)